MMKLINRTLPALLAVAITDPVNLDDVSDLPTTIRPVQGG